MIIWVIQQHYKAMKRMKRDLITTMCDSIFHLSKMSRLPYSRSSFGVRATYAFFCYEILRQMISLYHHHVTNFFQRWSFRVGTDWQDSLVFVFGDFIAEEINSQSAAIDSWCFEEIKRVKSSRHTNLTSSRAMSIRTTLKSTPLW